jgi:hypothetical protein
MFASKDLFFSKPSGGYQISRSVRLRSSASAYFNRTAGTATNQSIATWSFWFKRGTLGTTQRLFEGWTANSDSGNAQFEITTSDVFAIGGYTTNWLITTQVFRDPSAWYHIVVAFDTTQATASNRIKLYVNGSQVTVFGTAAYPTQNTTFGLNNNSSALQIGRRRINSVSDSFYDGYFTEINMVDGQQLTPSSFGQTNTVTGVWQPIKYAGTYGTNGFYLNFSDNSNNTATTIGKDNSGNGNNWTPNNISVTAGTTYDSMLDVPTPYADGGNGRGNYCVLNPIDTAGTAGSITDGNLKLTGGSVAWYGSRSGFGLTSGKWYWEVTILATNTTLNGVNIGLANSNSQTSGYGGSNVWQYNNNSGGRKNLNGTSSAYGTAFVTNDVVGVAFDADAGTLVFYVNNSSQGTAASSGLPNPAFPRIDCYGTDNVATNFGQRPFTYTPPSGYVALNTQNLPTPTISNGANYMAATTYTGTGSSLTIANTVNGISFYPDFVWVKGRSGATDHALYDSVRGTTKDLASNTTAAETTQATGLTAFSSTGFTVGALAKMNTNAATYVGWQWLANAGSSSSNTNGSITSTVSVNATAGFSVVTWAGNSTSGATVGHGLGVAPKLLITKSRTNASSWVVGIGNISGFGVNDYLTLSNTDAVSSSSTFYQAYGSSTFTVGVSAANEMNKTGNNYVTYAFSAVAGYSAFGKYTGNGSADGPFIFTGFRPRFVMVKRTDTTGSWAIEDTSRSPYNQMIASLYPDLSNAEVTIYDFRDYLSNGFKIRTTDTNSNANGGTYIYYAVAENPFKNSLAR